MRTDCNEITKICVCNGLSAIEPVEHSVVNAYLQPQTCGVTQLVCMHTSLLTGNAAVHTRLVQQLLADLCTL